MRKTTYTVIILAAGSGSRMKSKVKKQFMDFLGKPLIYYALNAFQHSPVNDIVLVTGKDAIEYCEKEIVEIYKFTKVKAVVEGGSERYESVYNGLKEVNSDYVLIHDGARAFVDEKIIRTSMLGVKKYKACVVGMPVKDTIRVVDHELYSAATPKRSTLWQVQTPQSFVTKEIKEAYKKMMEGDRSDITDDAMVMERYGNRKVKLLEGSYDNIKVTTPEDIVIGEILIQPTFDASRKIKEKIKKVVDNQKE